MTARAPLATREVRWFFEGASRSHESLRRWFETGALEWRGRLDGEPDVYLRVPGADDMGVKWREGELQIKGRVASLGTQRFGGRHEGRVERWVKWSYGELPAAYRELFTQAGARGLHAVSVRKTRALRELRLDPGGGICNVELVDLEVGGREHCSLAFEAFPDDSAMDAAFPRAVETFLSGLKEPALTANRSLSYPAWLALSISR